LEFRYSSKKADPEANDLHALAEMFSTCTLNAKAITNDRGFYAAAAAMYSNGNFLPYFSLPMFEVDPG
jgi:hypothetical protein